MSLKSILDNLEIEDRRRLIHAFNQHLSQHIVLPNNRFIGVNISIPNFQVEEQVGVWSTGKVIK